MLWPHTKAIYNDIHLLRNLVYSAQGNFLRLEITSFLLKPKMSC